MKKGISLVSTLVIIIVLLIFTGIIVITGTDAYNAVNVSTFALEILNIQTSIDEYYYRNSSYPCLSSITLNVSDMNANELAQFNGEVITDNNISLKTIDFSLIGINETEFGNQERANDMYAISEVTGKVYYLAGVEFEGELYYTVTEGLYKMVDASNVANNSFVSTRDIKRYDVIFTVSNANYTNKPITVTIKIPKTATFDSVTVTNSKSISEAVVLNEYNTIIVNDTSADKNGNYDIEVTYTYNGVQKTAEYSVTNFDNTAPQLAISVDRIGKNKIITVSATDAESGIKVIKYESEAITDYTYFSNYGKVVRGSQINIDVKSVCTVYVEDKAGNNYLVFENSGITTIPDSWKTNVSTITNEGVPIPKGFVASPYDGENTKNGGLVIYELASEETAIPTSEKHQTSLTDRNQYVWIPVDNYTSFKRQNFGKKTYSIVETDIGVSGYWEVILDSTNIPDSTKNTSDSGYMSEKTLSEVQVMYESVKKYGGFYIARYEAGIDELRKIKTDALVKGLDVYSRMNKKPYNYIIWGKSISDDTNGAVEVARSIYPNDDTNSTGVVSTLTYGVQRDRTIAWFVEVAAKDINGNIIDIQDSRDYGNYLNHNIESSDELNEDAMIFNYTGNSQSQYVEKESMDYPKNSSDGNRQWILTTGALKAAKINNIYDMAGNLYEWTMEGNSTTKRSNTGGAFYYGGDTYDITYRSAGNPSSGNYYGTGFRPSLYIKID